MTELPEETKRAFISVLQQAASQDKAVIEFTTNDDALYAKEITEHVEELERQVND